jgi:phosphoglycerol transferase MdoB-like AlkP superfamily enzyme
LIDDVLFAGWVGELPAHPAVLPEVLMFSRETGLLMRMLGPLIEVICLVLLFSFPGEERRIAGLPLRPFLYGGIAFGLILVIAGLTLVRREVPSRPFEREPADPVDPAT